MQWICTLPPTLVRDNMAIFSPAANAHACGHTANGMAVRGSHKGTYIGITGRKGNASLETRTSHISKYLQYMDVHISPL